MRPSVCILPLALTLSGVLLLAGCGGSGYNVQGKLVKGGAPVSVSEKGVVQMSFISVDDKAATSPYPVNLEKDGSFTVAGRGDVKGVPAGKYKVAVEIYDPYPGTDKLGGKFSKERTPIVQDVPANGPAVIDIGKS